MSVLSESLVLLVAFVLAVVEVLPLVTDPPQEGIRSALGTDVDLDRGNESNDLRGALFVRPPALLLEPLLLELTFDLSVLTLESDATVPTVLAVFVVFTDPPDDGSRLALGREFDLGLGTEFDLAWGSEFDRRRLLRDLLPVLPFEPLLSKLRFDLSVITLDSEEATVVRVDVEVRRCEGGDPLLNLRKEMSLLMAGLLAEPLMFEASLSIVPLVLALFLVEPDPCLVSPRAGTVVGGLRLSRGGVLDCNFGFPSRSRTEMLLMGGPSLLSSIIALLLDWFELLFSGENSTVIPFEIRESTSMFLTALLLFIIVSFTYERRRCPLS